MNEHIFVLDAGAKYPENEQLGVDVVVPNFDYLEENKHRVAGVFLSHGHADAIGALPYLLEKVKVPVFGSHLTIELAKLLVKGIMLLRNLMISMLSMLKLKLISGIQWYLSFRRPTLFQRV